MVPLRIAILPDYQTIYNILNYVMCDFYHWTSPSKSSGFRLRRILSHTPIEWVSILVVHRLCKCHASRTLMVCTWKRCTNWA